jgi:hypothetical protein
LRDLLCGGLISALLCLAAEVTVMTWLTCCGFWAVLQTGVLQKLLQRTCHDAE